MNVAALETAHDLHDRVHFADVTEELVAKPFARACTFHQSSDIDEFDRRRNDLLRVRQLRKRIEPRVWHRNDADVRVDRAEWIISSLRFLRARDRIEER